jgi:hypothetical protein
MRLQQEHRSRDLALLNLGLDSKLRACDLVSLKVRDVGHGEHVASRATVQQRKYQASGPVRDHGTRTRGCRGLDPRGRPARRGLLVPEPHPLLIAHLHAPVRTHAAGVVAGHGLDWHDYGTHSM